MPSIGSGKGHSFRCQLLSSPLKGVMGLMIAEMGVRAITHHFSCPPDFPLPHFGHQTLCCFKTWVISSKKISVIVPHHHSQTSSESPWLNSQSSYHLVSCPILTAPISTNLIYSFSKYVLNVFSVPGTVLDTERLMELMFWWKSNHEANTQRSTYGVR